MSQEQTEFTRHLESGEREPSNFREKLERLWERDNFVCVGLDSDWSKIPGEFKALGREEGTFQFNKQIIDATCDLVCAYKPNIAFYEDTSEGSKALKRTVDYLHQKHPYIPVICDAKRGDIDNTNDGYVREAFVRYKADAVTVNPYLGAEALKPFLKREDKGIIVLAKTSNRGGGEFQDLPVSVEKIAADREELMELIQATGKTEIPLYLVVAYRVARHWDQNQNCGLVVGATYPEELEQVRQLAPNVPILIPGIGAQEADTQKSVVAGMDKRTYGMIINSSRAIIFAQREELPNKEKESVGSAARRETQKLRETINFYRHNPEGLSESQKELARALYEYGMVQFGEFELKLHEKHPNAPMSPYYINLRILRSAPKEVKLLIAKVFSDLTADLQFDAYADTPTSITPVVEDLSFINDVPMITPRGEKRHGSGAKIDGIFEEGKTVAVGFDDVITSGESANDAIDKLRAGGILVKDFVVLVDREEGGAETIKNNGCKVHFAFTKSSLLRFYEREGIIDHSTYLKAVNYNPLGK
jgi:orotidine 5'-phosphate decarboxylase subfamily 2